MIYQADWPRQRTPSASWSDQVTISSRDRNRLSRSPSLPECLAADDRPPVADASRCAWLGFVRAQLQAIESLPDGWDSYGARRPDVRLVDSARGLIESLATAPGLPQPHVNPTPCEGVQFEWESETRYFEIEVIAQRAARFFFCDYTAAVELSEKLFEGDCLDEVIDYIRRVEMSE